MDRCKQLKKQKSENAKLLNKAVREDKEAGKRDKRGRLIPGKADKEPNGFGSLAALLETPLPTEIKAAKEMLNALNSLRASKVKNHSSAAAKARLKTLTEFIASAANENPG